MNVYFKIVISIYIFFLQCHECGVVSVSVCNFYCVNKLETWTLFFLSHTQTNTSTFISHRVDGKYVFEAMTMKKCAVHKTSNSLSTRSVSSSVVDREKKRNDRIDIYLTWARKKWSDEMKKNKYAFCARFSNVWMKSATSRLRYNKNLRTKYFFCYSTSTHSHTSVERTSHCFPLNLHRSATVVAVVILNSTKLKCIDLIFFQQKRAYFIRRSLHDEMDQCRSLPNEWVHTLLHLKKKIKVN